MKNNILIFIPTYNERENVGVMVERITAENLGADILFIDDNSPDGTGELINEIAKTNSNLYFQHRPGKLGIGSAHIDGIRWAYKKGYKSLITMDCDFTHSPKSIKDFIEAGVEADIVVGTRYKDKKSLQSWNAYRKLLTYLGNIATKTFLKMPYDATGAFRLYRLDKIPINFLDLVTSKGYSYFFESLFILHSNGFVIREVSTDLPARTYGHSKMKFKDAFQSLAILIDIFLTKHINNERFIVSEPFTSDFKNTVQSDKQGWDEYWAIKKDKTTLKIYDLIAAFYRKYIIRPSLDRVIKSNFNSNDLLLHAGAGSGQVDKNIGIYVNIHALDISQEALTFYKKANRNHQKLILGSIFDIPVPNNTYEGVYNLGVMEHFSENQIIEILVEFNRVLKKNGKIVLFWPPEFGLSVLFLKLAHFFLNKLFKKNILLHPPEISRVKSRKQIKGYLERAGFRMIRYSFGLRDFFTYVVVVGIK